MKSRLEADGTARTTSEVGWRDVSSMLTHHGNKNGCHVVAVPPEATTNEGAQCGVESDKPVGVREHSCPSWRLEVERAVNASLNVLSRGRAKRGVGHSDAPPVETATAVDAITVSARRVVDAGRPCRTAPPTAASRQG